MVLKYKILIFTIVIIFCNLFSSYLYADEWIKVDKRFRPNKKHAQIYKELARLFEAQIKSNRDVYQGLNRLRKKW